MIEEHPMVFDCEDDRLVGMLHAGEPHAETGVVIVVGGPQYRVGSHRQFVLMARRFAATGIPVLRFDVRGMGDSEGAPRTFDSLDEDIRAAVDAVTAHLPALRKVVLVGLCDAASANLIYCNKDSRVAGLILMNPWVRTAQGEAQTYLRHYYLQRLLQRSFWRKVISGQFAVARSFRDLLHSLRNARSPKENELPPEGQRGNCFISRMLSGLMGFERPILIVSSGRDFTAQEFTDLCRDNEYWKGALNQPKCIVREYPEADHTMSSRLALDSASECCVNWIIGKVGE